MSLDWTQDALDDLQEDGLRRQVETFDGAVATTGQLDGEEVLHLASNNYLGLTTHPTVTAAARQAATEVGTGAGASPLVSGHTRTLAQLEHALAELKGTEDAIVFPSGYHANTGTLPTLVGEGDLVLSDTLNHASLIDACRLANADVEVYLPGDTENLAELLDAHREAHRRCLIVTDGVFSMDGQTAPLDRLVELAREHEAMLMVDDAHATGVLGATGAGTVEHHGLPPEAVDVHMGTLSKALASQGGFIAGTQGLCDLLRNRARSYVFSTARAPPSAAAAHAALQVVHDEPERRDRLHANADHLRYGLRSLGFEVLGEGTPIVPVVVGDRHTALDLAEALLGEGVFCPAIRPPSVREGTSRLRATVTATHTTDQIDLALEAFETAGHRTGVLA